VSCPPGTITLVASGHVELLAPTSKFLLFSEGQVVCLNTIFLSCHLVE